MFDKDKQLLNRASRLSTGNCALHLAEQHGNKDMVLLLVEYGANPDQKNKAEDTTREFVSTCLMKDQQSQVANIIVGPANFFSVKTPLVEKNAVIPIVDRKVKSVQKIVVNDRYYQL